MKKPNNQDTKRFGGKGSGLMWLAQNTDLGYIMPTFEIIDTSYYEDFLRQPIMAQIVALLHNRANPGDNHVGVYEPKCPERLEERCRELLTERFSGRAVAVRSSAVISEDSERLSGAGIYETFFLQEDELTPKSLADAVLKVYASVNSPKAVQYRKMNSLGDERMAVIVQEFIEPDLSGVVYTSNPSYPDDLSIEFVKGRNTVVEGHGSSLIVDFDKESKKEVFMSENLRHSDIWDNAKTDIENLVDIGIELEKRSAALDLEFVIKDRRLFLVQSRRITDLQYPVEVEIPKYKPKQFIGSTKIKRGTGKLTLPVVRIQTYHDIIMKLDNLISLLPDMATQIIREYFDNIVLLNNMHKEGYLLLIPSFEDTAISEIGDRGILKYDTRMDSLTTNKKAVITTNQGSISSHIMTVAREKGIAYAGFENDDELFKNVSTGDILSIYFKGREALVYKEKAPKRGIKESMPHISFKVKETKSGINFHASADLGAGEPFGEDFELFLNETTDLKWKYKPHEGMCGGIFTNKKGENIVMSMMRCANTYTEWSFSVDSTYCSAVALKPFQQEKLDEIVRKYADYLTK